MPFYWTFLPFFGYTARMPVFSRISSDASSMLYKSMLTVPGRRFLKTKNMLGSTEKGRRELYRTSATLNYVLQWFYNFYKPTKQSDIFWFKKEKEIKNISASKKMMKIWYLLGICIIQNNELVLYRNQNQSIDLHFKSVDRFLYDTRLYWKVFPNWQ